MRWMIGKFVYSVSFIEWFFGVMQKFWKVGGENKVTQSIYNLR
jgi:hypothetical protein